MAGAGTSGESAILQVVGLNGNIVTLLNPVTPDVLQLPPTIFQFTEDLVVTGSEIVGSVIGFSIIAAQLPSQPFFWVHSGTSLSNFGNTGALPSGQWMVRIEADWGDGLGLIWRAASTTLDFVANFPDASNRVFAAPASDSTRWVDIAVQNTINYQWACVVPPTGAFNLKSIFAGNIYYV